MGFVDCLQHCILRYLIGPCLNHDHFFRRRGNCQFEISVLPFFLGRIHNKFPVHQSDLCHGTGPGKGNIGNGCGNGCAQHSHQLRTARRVHRHHHIVQRHIISVIFGEQRAHGPVDHTAGQNRIFGSLPLPLVKAAGNLSHSIQFLFKFHTQREEINPFPGLFRSCSRTEHRRFSILHKSTTICLLSHFADLHL